MSWFWVDAQVHGIYAFVNAVHSCHVACDDDFSSLFNPTFPRVGNCCVLSLSLLNPHQFIPRYYPQLCKSPFNHIKQVWHTVLPVHLLADISPRALDLLHSGLATVEDAAWLSPPNPVHYHGESLLVLRIPAGFQVSHFLAYSRVH